MKPIPTSELAEHLPHRAPMLWVDEVVSYAAAHGDNLLHGVCRAYLTPGRHFFGDDGALRVSSPIEWIAQSYGFVKSCVRISQGLGPARGRVFLVGVNDVDVDLAGIRGEKTVLVHVRETRDLEPAFLLDGSVTSEDGTRIFAKLKMKVFAGEMKPVPLAPADAP